MDAPAGTGDGRLGVMPQLPPPITSRTNARVKALRAALSGEARRPGDLLGLEGEHLVEEAHYAGYRFEAVYLRDGSEDLLARLEWLSGVATSAWVVLSRDAFESAVTTHSPQGIAATWRIEQPPARHKGPASTLVLEHLQDPGNLGTLIRSAESFGFGRIMVTPGTVNQWNPKVLRAGAGSVLRVPVLRAPMEVICQQLRDEGVRLFAAVPYFTGAHDLAARQGVLTGRISNGAAPESMKYPLPASEGGFAASLSYDTDFEQPCAVVIGNEGNGLSEEALALADEQVQIPGMGGREGLNAAVAGSILMYECMSQIPLRAWARKQGLRA